MAKSVSRLLRFIERESLSFHLIAIALLANLWAWVIPRGDYRHPAKDLLGLQTFVSQQMSDITLLHYFWNGVLALTVISLAVLSFKASIMLMNALRDRVDL